MAERAIKIVVYGSYECDDCTTIKDAINALKLPMDFRDANAEIYQEFLDSFSVERLPFVQLIDEDGNVVWQESGDDEITLKKIVDQYAIKSRAGTSS